MLKGLCARGNTALEELTPELSPTFSFFCLRAAPSPRPSAPKASAALHPSDPGNAGISAASSFVLPARPIGSRSRSPERAAAALCLRKRADRWELSGRARISPGFRSPARYTHFPRARYRCAAGPCVPEDRPGLSFSFRAEHECARRQSCPRLFQTPPQCTSEHTPGVFIPSESAWDGRPMPDVTDRCHPEEFAPGGRRRIPPGVYTRKLRTVSGKDNGEETEASPSRGNATRRIHEALRPQHEQIGDGPSCAGHAGRRDRQ